MRLTLSFLLVACFLLAVSAKSLDFALQYTGTCRFDAKGNGLCETKAPSQDIRTSIKSDGGVESSVKRLLGSLSQLKFNDIYDPSTMTFTSNGTMSFGVHATVDKHKFDFENEVMGRVNGTPFPNEEYAFAVVWKLTKGYGVFENALGTITANGVYTAKTNEVILGVYGFIWYAGSSSTSAAIL